MNHHIFALLVGVGNYTQLNIKNLPSYRMDVALMETALVKGLKCCQEHIRLMSGEDNNGIVNVNDFVRGISNFGRTLSEQDTFIFYFSGHGSEKTLTFSNSQLDQQSVITYIDKIPCKNKIVFLDCCYSGKFEALHAKHIDIEKSVDSFAGHGIAIYASSSADEVSRIGFHGNHSIFTGALAAALLSENVIHKGKIELNDVCKETNRLIDAWNDRYPEKKQNPVYRSSIGGTIYFQVADYQPYIPKDYSADTEKYGIASVNSLGRSDEKQLRVFVVLHEMAIDGMLTAITKEIAEQLKYADVYSSKEDEDKFSNAPAKAIWCYFGNDESDIINHTYQYYTIWAMPDERKKYFRENRNSRIVDDIYIFENTSYALVKRMQINTIPREEYIAKYKGFLKLFIDMAEDFLIDFQEVANKTLTYEKLQKKYGQWIKTVKREFVLLSDMETAPDDLHDWTEEILQMSGYVLDLSILLEGDNRTKKITEREEWLINHARKQYCESIEKLKKIEDKHKVALESGI